MHAHGCRRLFTPWLHNSLVIGRKIPSALHPGESLGAPVMLHASKMQPVVFQLPGVSRVDRV